MDFKDFLELSEDEQIEYLTGIELHLWQKLYIKWWTSMKKANPHLKASVLWESIYKGRF